MTLNEADTRAKLIDPSMHKRGLDANGELRDAATHPEPFDASVRAK